MKHLAAAASLVIAIVALPATAQTAIQPGTITGTFSADGYAGTGVLFTVPAGRNARITDIRAINFGTIPCFFYVQFGPNAAAYYGVTTQYQTISDHMVSGYGMTDGQIVQASTSNCAAGNVVFVQVRGFYFTIP